MYFGEEGYLLVAAMFGTESGFASNRLGEICIAHKSGGRIFLRSSGTSHPAGFAAQHGKADGWIDVRTLERGPRQQRALSTDSLDVETTAQLDLLLGGGKLGITDGVSGQSVCALVNDLDDKKSGGFAG